MKKFFSAYRFLPAADRTWLELRLFIMGVTFLLAGCVCFVAANWANMGVALKISLPLVMLVLCGAGVYYKNTDTLAGQGCMFGAAVAIGLFWAVFGQLYPCGAFLYEMLGWWALLLIPLCVLANNKWLWLFFLYVACAYLKSRELFESLTALSHVMELALVAWAIAYYKKTSLGFQRFIWVPLTIYVCCQCSGRIPSFSFAQANDLWGVYFGIGLAFFTLECVWAHFKKENTLFGMAVFCAAVLLSAVTWKMWHENFLSWFVNAFYFISAGAATFFFYHFHKTGGQKTTAAKAETGMPLSVRVLLFLCAFVGALSACSMLWLMHVSNLAEGILLLSTGWLLLYKVKRKQQTAQSFLHYLGLVIALAGQWMLGSWATEFFGFKNDEWIFFGGSVLFYLLFPHTLLRLLWSSVGAVSLLALVRHYVGMEVMDLMILLAFAGAVALIHFHKKNTYPLAYGLLVLCVWVFGAYPDHLFRWMSVYMPVVFGILLMYVGHKRMDRYAEIFGLVGAVCGIFHLYYALEISLSYKALTLVIGGLLCLVLRRKYAR